MDTRHTTISARKLAHLGAAYESEWVGTTAVFTTYDGERLVGEIVRFDGGYPIVEFADGRWARLDLHVEVAA